MAKLAIVTGASRGLGEALALDFLSRGYDVIGVSRHDSPRLRHERYRFANCDLGDTGSIEPALAKTFEEAAAGCPQAATLINNAATADPVGVFGRMAAGEIVAAIDINLAAPAVIAELF